jgi:hypothetical protein
LLKDKLSSTPVLAFPYFKLSFILTTDDSSVGVVAVSSQVQGGIERPILLSSRQLNKSESLLSLRIGYPSSCMGHKILQLLPYRARVLVRTDYATLRFLRSFAENNSRLMRCSLRLSEFQLDIEHVPGSKVKQVDALSRHVGLVEPQIMSKEFIIREQKKDSFCKEHVQNCQTVNSEYFLDMDDALYRRAKGKLPKLVVPVSDARRNSRKSQPHLYRSPRSKRTLGLIPLKYW